MSTGMQASLYFIAVKSRNLGKS